MDLLQPPFSPPSLKIPVLLRIPDLDSIRKRNEIHVPLLKANLSNTSNDYHGQNIFRLPAEYYKEPLVPFKGLKTELVHPHVPKLIDIRSVLNKKRVNESKVIRKPDKSIELIKLPIVQCKTPLLNAPERTEVIRPKPAEKEQPQLVDIRPFKPQESLNLIDTKNIGHVRKHWKPAKARSRKVSGKASSSSRSNSHPKFTDIHADDASSTFEAGNDRIEKEKVEEELYHVISELLMKRKKKKSWNRIRLFDIIDSIPITSDSEVDDVPVVRKSKPRGKEGNVVGQDRKEIKHVNEKSFIKSSLLADVPHPFDISKPKPSRFISKHDDDAALSWANIIKAARQETQSTQTETKKVSIELVSQEIQTEIKEMVEIPKVQTFFKSTQGIGQTVKRTNEFCDRVRKEVEEKLADIKVNEDKYCQTACDVGMQTDGELSPKNQIQTTVTCEKTFSPHSQIPPDMHAGLQFERSNAVAKRDFINVVDFDSKQIDAEISQHLQVENVEDKVSEAHSFKLESIDGYMARIVLEDSKISSEPKVSGMIEVIEEKNNVALIDRAENIISASNDENVETEAEVLQKNDLEFSLSDVLSSINARVALRNHGVKKEIRDSDIKSTEIPDESRAKSEASGKNKLQNNISEFSVGLNALNDIHENIEKELKQSKFLFGMIETLHHDFMSDGEAVNSNSVDSLSVVMDFPIPGMKSYDEIPSVVAYNGSDREGSGVNPVHKEITAFEIHRAQSEELLNEFLSSDDNMKQNSHKSKIENKIEFGPYSFDSLDQLDLSKHLGKSFGSGLKTNEDMLSRRNSRPITFADVKESSAGKQEGNKFESEKDRLFKEELKKRICSNLTSGEIQMKQDEGKRRKLMKWLKTKRLERHKLYLEELSQKRGAEHRPFVSNRRVAGNEIKQNMSFREQVKRAVLEEDNHDRMSSAKRLASAVISNDPTMLGTSPHSNNRYKKTYTLANQTRKVPIRETRASRIRKMALVSDIIKKQQMNQTVTKIKRKRASYKSKGNKNQKFEGKSKKETVSTKRMDDLQSCLVVNSDAGGRRSVEAHKFVTRDSYDDYILKSSLLLQQTMQEYKDFVDDAHANNNNDFNQYLTSSRLSNRPLHDHDMNTADLDLRYTEARRKNSLMSVNSSAENVEVKSLLQKYGMDIGSGLFEKTLGTSQLLAEVELALLEDSDVASELTVQSENIDWDEIDKILDE